MESLLTIIILYYIVLFLLLIDTIETEHLDKISRKKIFCGRRLTGILGQFCLEYPSLDNERPFRVKRQIINDCCRNKCSLNYLLENYCQTVNISALEAFKREDDSDEIISSLPPTTTQSTLSRRYRQKNNLENIQYGKPTNLPFPQNKKHRKRRNCSCMKRFKLEKLRRERRLWRTLTSKTFPIQEAQIGEIKDSQEPFYFNNFV